MRGIKIVCTLLLALPVSIVAGYAYAAEAGARPPNSQRPQTDKTSARQVEPSADDAIPPGTTIPVRLDSSLNSQRTKPGQVIVARVMQDISLPTGIKIYAGSRLIGHVTRVSEAGEDKRSEISFRFDELSLSNRKVPINLELRALASRLDVEGAQTPAMGPDEATPETSWTVVQVGGDVVYRGGGVVMRGPDLVGKPLWPSDGVVEFDENHRPQAVGVFSLDASGTYGFSGATIANDRRTNEADLITVSAEKGTLKVRSGAAMLLTVDSARSRKLAVSGSL